MNICVVKDVQYQYWVQVEAGGLLSELSPSLLYTHPQPFCGDGLLQGSVRLRYLSPLSCQLLPVLPVLRHTRRCNVHCKPGLKVLSEKRSLDRAR